jgi:hypothetical protein
MDNPEYNLVKVWNQTKEYYKDYPEKSSTVFRRNTNITHDEINTLPQPHPKIMNAPIIEEDCIYVAIDYKKEDLILSFLICQIG